MVRRRSTADGHTKEVLLRNASDYLAILLRSSSLSGAVGGASAVGAMAAPVGEHGRRELLQLSVFEPLDGLSGGVAKLVRKSDGT